MKSPRCILWIEPVSTWITPWEPQDEGSVHDQPRSGRPPKVLGCLNRNNDFRTYMFEQATRRGVVIPGGDTCCQTIKQKTLMRLDSASIQTSKGLEEHIAFWKTHGLILKSSPPYARELKLIEILGVVSNAIGYRAWLSSI
jgi:hypothetical protein